MVILALLISSVHPVIYAAEQTECTLLAGGGAAGLQGSAAGASSLSDDFRNQKYLEYDKQYRDTANAKQSIEINPLEFSDAQDVSPKVILNESAAIYSGTGYVKYTFDVPETARYILTLRYIPVEGKNSNIEREIMIDGDYPFDEARNVEFSRIFRYADGYVKTDSNSNEYFNGTAEVFEWTEYSVTDSYGYYNQPFAFFLTAGSHELTFNSVKEPMAVSKIRFEPASELMPYSEYRQSIGNVPSTGNENKTLVIEAENPKYVSDTVLYPSTDRSSPDTTPVSAFNLRLNMISGTRWQNSGQWIEWETDIAESGLYKISLRVRQNFNDGMFTTRKLLVDGSIPFQEAENLTFRYDTAWQTITAGGEEPYYIYFEKGTHSIRLQNTLGDMAEILVVVDDVISRLNACYVDILTITGPSPDQFRDYKLDKLISGTITNLGLEADRLTEILKVISDTAGIKGSYLSAVERVALQCKEMSAKPDRIPRLFDNFKNDLGSLALWLSNSQQQPLDIDKIYVTSPEIKVINAKSNFFVSAWHKIVVFISSFFNDINSFGSSADKSVLTVWLGSGVSAGRDQAMILKKMIDDTYAPDENTPVNFQLVAPGTLLPASLSGRGPDVALRIGATDAMNFALRGAVLDLSEFPDFKEITKRFNESAIVPLTFNDASYALPETQTFPVMFYRKDILQNLGLEPPETWDDVYGMLPVLQRSNMNFAVPVTNFSSNEAFGISGNQTNGFKSFAMLLFQRNGELYRENGKYSALDGKIQAEVFNQWTNLYRNYKLPLAYEFANRFAMGEIPVGIADYTVYNTLMVYFQEIKGLWSFMEVPGTIQADGSVNHSVPGDVVGSIIMKTTTQKEAAWNFLKFWTGSQAQIRFGREMEAMLGPSARWPSANIEAVKQTAWNSRDLDNLLLQFKYVKGVSEVPGGYYTSRYLDLSFRRVVYYKDNVKDTLFSNVRIINEELSAKRNEFGIRD